MWVSYEEQNGCIYGRRHNGRHLHLVEMKNSVHQNFSGILTTSQLHQKLTDADAKLAVVLSEATWFHLQRSKGISEAPSEELSQAEVFRIIDYQSINQATA